MELRHLRDFVAVAEEGSFTRAALKIHVTQPSLTRQIKNLEEELGAQLLVRSSNGVSLTASGQAFFLSAKRVLAINAEGVAAIKNTKQTKRPELRIGYLSALYCDPLAQTLGLFRRAHPQVGINLFEMTITEQLAALAEGKLDLGFIGPTCENLDPRLRHKFVANHDVLVAVCQSDPLAKKLRLSLQDLDAYFLVALSSRIWPGWRRWITELFAAARLDWQVIQEAESETAALQLVALGLGVAFIPERVRSLRHGGVTLRPLSPRLRIRSAVAWSAENESDGLRNYLQVIRETSCTASAARSKSIDTCVSDSLLVR
jgi:DNA-binding transcriptional LysR family regulator